MSTTSTVACTTLRRFDIAGQPIDPFVGNRRHRRWSPSSRTGVAPPARHAGQRVEQGRLAGIGQAHDAESLHVVGPRYLAWGRMDPEQALARIVHCLDRAHIGGFKTKASTGALARVRETDPEEIARLSAAGDLKALPGIGDASAKVIGEALAGRVPTYLEKLEAETVVPITPDGAVIRAALRGDCHSHSTWSDGGASIEAMATTARDLGHDYLVLTDHSGRLTVAHGLNRERLLVQLDEVAALNEDLAPFVSLRAWKSTSSKTAVSTSTTTCSLASMSWSPASTPSFGRIGSG